MRSDMERETGGLWHSQGKAISGPSPITTRATLVELLIIEIHLKSRSHLIGSV